MQEVKDLEEFVKRSNKVGNAVREIMDLFAQSPVEESEKTKEDMAAINKLLDERDQMNDLMNKFLNVVKEKEDK